MNKKHVFSEAEPTELRLFSLFQSYLDKADIQIGGSRPWDIQLHDPSAFEQVLQSGAEGLGDSYIDGAWDCDDLADMISRVLGADIDHELTHNERIKLDFVAAKSRIKQIFNAHSIQQSKKDISFHYDLGNDLFSAMLDPQMVYSCGYWRNADTLTKAQENKLDLICRKLGLKPGMRLLDIGCGWGSLMLFAARNYGVVCEGLTLSEEQAKWGKEVAKQNAAPVQFHMQDYRSFTSRHRFDRIVSIGMAEHIGVSNYRNLYSKAHQLLEPDGMFLLHCIGTSDPDNDGSHSWISKRIFPHGVIPTLAQLSSASEQLFNIEDVQNIGPDYDPTLCAWYENFEKNWPQLREKYGERFFRLWRYYLLSCAGAFRSRRNSVWQIAMTQIGSPQPTTVRAI